MIFSRNAACSGVSKRLLSLAGSGKNVPLEKIAFCIPRRLKSAHKEQIERPSLDYSMGLAISCGSGRAASATMCKM